jgi:hypothetical protein
MIYLHTRFYTSNGNIRSRDGVVGIATGYGLDDRGVGVRVPVESRIFFSPRRPASYPMGTGALSPGVKWPGLEADHTSNVSMSRKCGSIHPLPHTSSWRSA